MRQAEFFVILARFLPLMIPKIKILKKNEKSLQILSFYAYMCTINEDHMIYGSCNIGCDRQNFFVILGHFLHFQPPDNPENQNFKIEKNTWRYHFTHLQHKWQSYDVWHLRYGVWQTEFFVILDRFSPFYFPNNPKNQHFEKKLKSHLEISFYTGVP